MNNHTAHEPPRNPASLGPLTGLPTRLLVARIFTIEGWLIDLAAGCPGALVAGLDPVEVDKLCRHHLARLRAELRSREGIGEVAL
ncbi:MAG: hypothetical protein M3Q71_08320 [Chloroflexota bacterium]|nr:hypothetical protein [Chloroflexota bacterium]